MSDLPEDVKKMIEEGQCIEVFLLKDGEVVGSEEYNMPEHFPVTDEQIERLARALRPSIEKYYSDPENVKEAAEWIRKKKSGEL